MTTILDYESDLFRSVPDASGKLALCFSKDSFTIGVLSAANITMLLKEISNEHQKPFETFVKGVLSQHQALFARNFNSVHIGVHVKDFTLLPISLNERLNKKTDPNRQLDELPEHHSKLLYQVDYDLVQTFDNTFENYSLYHAHTPVLKHISTLPFNSNLLLHLQDYSVDVYGRKDGKLVFCNSFNISSEKDVTYYALLVAKNHLDMVPESSEIAVTGKILAKDDNHQSLLRFFKEVHITDLDNKTVFRPDLDVKKHYYFHLLMLLHENNKRHTQRKEIHSA